jgi:predicted Zn-dependent peptidase
MEESRAVANDLAAQELLRGDIESLEARISTLDAVTLADVRSVAEDVITSEKMAMATVGPVQDWATFEKVLNF